MTQEVTRMTSPRWDASDDWLMGEIKAAVSTSGPVPEHAITAARAAYTWRTIDEELEVLSLSFDSADETAALVRGSSEAAPRMLLFEGRGLGVEVEITSGSLTGQLIPPQPGHVTLSTAVGPFADGAADEAGCFLLARPPAGPVRLRCETSQASLITEWMPL
jgi:hypothetical protein